MHLLLECGLLILLFCPFKAYPSKKGIDKVYRNKLGSNSYKEYGFGKSYALVIGISKYKKLSNIEAASVDAKRMAKYLIKDSGFDYVHILTDDKASKERIDSLMVDFFPKKLEKNDMFLFYFSGHGTQQYIDNKAFGYIALTNSSKKSYSSERTPLVRP